MVLKKQTSRSDTDTWTLCCFDSNKYKRKKSYQALNTFIKFLLHLLFVMTILVVSACVFMHLEENGTSQRAVMNGTALLRNIEDILKEKTTIQKRVSKINILVYNYRRNEVSADITTTYEIFMKWFSFCNVAATTIGYGDVAPSTQEARIFFIPFTIIAIPSMMTLLARCGEIMTLCNTYILHLIRHCCCRKKLNVSGSMISAIILFIFLTGFIHIGVLIVIATELEWTYVDSIYYWFATFTTIGLGDINYPINNTEYFITFYRLFALALLAGIIDSLIKWAHKRKNDIEQIKTKELMLKLSSSDTFAKLKELKLKGQETIRHKKQRSKSIGSDPTFGAVNFKERSIDKQEITLFCCFQKRSHKEEQIDIDIQRFQRFLLSTIATGQYLDEEDSIIENANFNDTESKIRGQCPEHADSADRTETLPNEITSHDESQNNKEESSCEQPKLAKNCSRPTNESKRRWSKRRNGINYNVNNSESRESNQLTHKKNHVENQRQFNSKEESLNIKQYLSKQTTESIEEVMEFSEEEQECLNDNFSNNGEMEFVEETIQFSEEECDYSIG